MSTGETVELKRELLRLAHRGLHVAAFAREATRLLKRAVPFDGICWFTVDPATLLPTSHIAIDSIRPEDVPRLAQNEFLEEDVNKVAVLARGVRAAETLCRATAGAPEASARFREILAPNGFVDELRAALVCDGTCWGGMAMYRRSLPHFVDNEAGLLAASSALLAEGLRRAILVPAAQAGDPEGAPGLVLLDESDRVEAVSPAARRWLDALVIEGSRVEGLVPNVVQAVASRARRIATGGEEEAPARTRLQTASGQWLVLHGAMLEAEGSGRVAVIIEPAHAPEIAPLLVEAYGLTERERDVTRLVLQGLSTAEIARELWLSSYTVQDHLKAIFDKVGVRSRRELVAQIFFQHYAPRMGHGEGLRADGWFADAAT
jgi:DNA-binding CsgD family transcriptional regulator